MKRKAFGIIMVMTAALGVWVGRKTADVVGVALYVIRTGDVQADDSTLAVQMFDAVHDMLTGDLELRLTEEGLRP